ncbi:MAG: folate-binding protein [Leptolyngbyaceae cyanobacterium bins.302]|nr:folate-binding protein [Leptolyngbyaceae cyanobacterium bins.302]
MHQLRQSQAKHGAIFTTDANVPETFGNDETAIPAIAEGVAVCDRSHWGRIQLTDADRQTFLHNQSTNNIQSLKPGEGCDTLFVTSTARTIDLATVYVLEASVLVVVSPNRREYLLQWLDRYIFFGDKVKLQDVTDQTALFSLVGAGSKDLLQRLGVETSPGSAYASHQEVTLAGCSVRLAVGSGLASPGYSLMVAADQAAIVWEALVEAGGLPLGDRAWEQLRIQQGRPAPDYELTEEFNAVEACLWQAISINKGCYIGQETIARLDTYQGVKQQIWGIQLQAESVEVGTPITLEEEKIGVLTSITATPDGAFGLGYVRTKAGGAGLQVQVGNQSALLIEVPFLQRDRASN